LSARCEYKVQHIVACLIQSTAFKHDAVLG
jgi:hypothetical protein